MTNPALAALQKNTPQVAEVKKEEVAKPAARLFKSHTPSNTMLMENGKPCIFRNGRYVTDDPKEIEFFEAEIARGNSYIYVDANEPEVVAQESVADMMERLRKEAYAQALKDIAGGRGDAGSSAALPAGTGALTSAGIADMASNAGATITPASK